MTEMPAMADTLTREALEARETVARWMMSRGLATGHGDTIEDLLAEAGVQIDERLADRAQILLERDEALARVGALETTLAAAELQAVLHDDMSLLDTKALQNLLTAEYNRGRSDAKQGAH